MRKTALFQWTAGGAMVPLARYRANAKRSFEPGTVYRLTVEDQRSAKLHNHYFAQLHLLWESLPETIDCYFPDPDHLRKWALIATGYEQRQVVHCATEREASHVVALLSGMDPGEDYRNFEIRGTSVHVVRPRSQSLKAMSPEEFQRSKEAVISYCTDLVERRITLP